MSKDVIVHTDVRNLAGHAESWEEAAGCFGEFAENLYGSSIKDWNNFTQLRVLCVDAILKYHGHDPKHWKFQDHTEETANEFVITIGKPVGTA